MATTVLTYALVCDAATAILGEGGQVTLEAVRERIGGGSFTTLKPLLDQWHAERVAASVAREPVPAEIASRTDALARAIWAMAQRLAQYDVDRLRREGEATEALYRESLAEARKEIARLEGVEARHEETIGRLQVRLAQAQQTLVQLQEQARRAEALDALLASTRAELDEARAEIVREASYSGHVDGRAEALREELDALIATFRPSPSE